MAVTVENEYRAMLQSANSARVKDLMNLLSFIRKENIRDPDIVLSMGKKLIDSYSWRLGNSVWSVLEQVFVAALDTQDSETAECCLKKLGAKFKESARVSRLRGMYLEFQGRYDEASRLYDHILQENSANALVHKRKIAILKAQGKMEEMIAALNVFLKIFQIDPAAWLELAEAYAYISALSHAAFCYEELVLIHPMHSMYHLRLADIYCSIGGIENLLAARKHYSHSFDIQKSHNVRALFGLIVCTRLIDDCKGKVEDRELNQRVLDFATKALESEYNNYSSPELAQIAFTTLN